MATVQISPNSILLSAADVNPLAHPAYQNPSLRIKELNNKAVEQIKTDTVTISQEAIAKSLELSLSEEASGKKGSNEIKDAPKVNQPKSQVSPDVTGKNNSESSMDQVTISKEASLKSALFRSIAEAASVGNPQSSYEKLRL
jgi:hypothetical protein